MCEWTPQAQTRAIEGMHGQHDCMQPQTSMRCHPEHSAMRHAMSHVRAPLKQAANSHSRRIQLMWDLLQGEAKAIAECTFTSCASRAEPLPACTAHNHSLLCTRNTLHLPVHQTHSQDAAGWCSTVSDGWHCCSTMVRQWRSPQECMHVACLYACMHAPPFFIRTVWQVAQPACQAHEHYGPMRQCKALARPSPHPSAFGQGSA